MKKFGPVRVTEGRRVGEHLEFDIEAFDSKLTVAIEETPDQVVAYGAVLPDELDGDNLRLPCASPRIPTAATPAR